MSGRYHFSTIFDLNLQAGVITIKFNVVINGIRFSKGTIVPRGMSLGGIDLFNLLGRDISGTWDQATESLSIIGFYEL